MGIRKFSHLTLHERIQIEVMLKQKYSIRKIAKELKREYKTVYYEIKNKSVLQIKNDKEVYIYYADTAQKIYEKNRKNSRNTYKYCEHHEFISLLESIFFEKKWSIQVCVEYIKKNYPNVKSLCFKTIYNYIEQGFTKIKNIDLLEKVSRKKTLKRKQKESKRAFGTSIEERQQNEEIEERIEFGHWEGDTVRGIKRENEPCLLTLVERKTRFMIIKKIKNATAAEVGKSIIKIMKEYGSDVFKSITFDNGTEFSSISNLVKKHKLNSKIYFAHPYASYERGTNERHNRLIRRFIKKSVSFSLYADKAIFNMQNWINNLPRKILFWKSPDEVFCDEISNLPFCACSSKFNRKSNNL